MKLDSNNCKNPAVNKNSANKDNGLICNLDNNVLGIDGIDETIIIGVALDGKPKYGVILLGGVGDVQQLVIYGKNISGPEVRSDFSNGLITANLIYLIK